jgi:hypothetical protein
VSFGTAQTEALMTSAGNLQGIGSAMRAANGTAAAPMTHQVERSSLQKIATQMGADLFDPRDFFCSSGECTTQRHEVDLYRDAFHFSANASRMLEPSLAGASNRLP